MSQGHANAARYPLAYLWNETRFTQDRINGMLKTDAVIMQTVIVQALAGGEHLKNLLEKLDGD